MKIQTLRIIALLAVIFAAGVFTGRVTAPKPLILVPSANGRLTTSAEVLNHLKRQIALEPEQEKKFGELLEEMAGGMTQHPPATQERLDLFRSYIPGMEALLRPHQKEDFQKYIRDTEARFQRVIRRKESGLQQRP